MDESEKLECEASFELLEEAFELQGAAMMETRRKESGEEVVLLGIVSSDDGELRFTPIAEMILGSAPEIYEAPEIEGLGKGTSRISGSGNLLMPMPEPNLSSLLEGLEKTNPEATSRVVDICASAILRRAARDKHRE